MDKLKNDEIDDKELTRELKKRTILESPRIKNAEIKYVKARGVFSFLDTPWVINLLSINDLLFLFSNI